MNNKRYQPKKLLSDNDKTNVSFNFPIKGHCTPTKNCRKFCYACKWHMAREDTVKKQNFVSKYFRGNDLTQAVWESNQYRAIRWLASGDFKRKHVPNVIRLAELCPNTKFYGMTRKEYIAYEINGKLDNLNILVSVDGTSPKSVWDYEGKLCYGPRLEVDIVPDDPQIITVFPRHCHGRVIKGIPHHEKDCPAVWKKISGCMECGQCWEW